MYPNKKALLPSGALFLWCFTDTMEREATRGWLVGKVWEKREGNKKIVNPGLVPTFRRCCVRLKLLSGAG